MLVGGMVIENPYYLTPDEVLAKAVQRDTGTVVIQVTKEAEQWYSGVMTG
jgi:methylmalonyl-CoA mutase cobalamin-binding subunit